MKNIILSLFLVVGLSACASTSAPTPTSAFSQPTLIDRVYEHRDEINTATEQAGQMLKKGGHLLGQGLEKAGELLQEATK